MMLLCAEYSQTLTAVLASSCWLSFALLHHDLGYQYLATQEAKTGKAVPYITFIFIFVYYSLFINNTSGGATEPSRVVLSTNSS